MPLTLTTWILCLLSPPVTTFAMASKVTMTPRWLSLSSYARLGCGSFYIALDDINPRLNCDSDAAQFPSRGPLDTAG